MDGQAFPDASEVCCCNTSIDSPIHPKYNHKEMAHNSRNPQSALRNLQKLPSACGNTYTNQTSLPRLPIPSLSDTLDKYTARLTALLTPEQIKQTKKDVNRFMEGDGPKLQKALQAYEKEGVAGSYVEEFWNESYLSPDASVVLNLNPFFLLEEHPDPKIAGDQLKSAASLCFAALKMASVVRHQKLAPDVFKGQPLCMDQFKALFGSSRQPTEGCDDVHVFNDSCHVVVLSQNHIYYFTALWPESGNLAVDEHDLLDILRAINAYSAESQPGLGVLTSLSRNKWAVARAELCKQKTNSTALRIIDSALFVLVLDDFTPGNIHRAAANVLHGTNILADDFETQIGTCMNRWYDKLQLIVCKDGTSGLIFEHSIIDGHTALRFVSDIYAETLITFAESIVDLVHGRGHLNHVLDAKVERGNQLDVRPKKLVFDISEKVMKHIYHAEIALGDEISANDTYVLEFRDFGKKLVVANKLSPDAFVQMMILLAYYRLYGRADSMYEPALTKRFFHGRTEAIRGTTPQAKAFCEVFLDKSSSKKTKLAALRAATTEHSRLTKEASSGLGVDRHLFALKSIAVRENLPVPDIFESVGWKKLNHTVLSTSNCGNPSLRLFGFGPVVPDGFGVGYIIKDHGFSFNVCSKHRQTKRYVNSLRRCLNDVQAMMEPISNVKVQHRAPPEQDSDGYGDLWGMHQAPKVSKLPPGNETMVSATGGQYFTGIKEKLNSVGLLGDKRTPSFDVFPGK